MTSLLGFFCLVLLLFNVAQGLEFAVDSSDDTVPPMIGTLRWAIEQTILNPGPNTITFNFTGTSVQTITLIDLLPSVPSDVSIHGLDYTACSEPDLCIELTSAAGVPLHHLLRLNVGTSNIHIDGIAFGTCNFGIYMLPFCFNVTLETIYTGLQADGTTEENCVFGIVHGSIDTFVVKGGSVIKSGGPDLEDGALNSPFVSAGICSSFACGLGFFDIFGNTNIRIENVRFQTDRTGMLTYESANALSGLSRGAYDLWGNTGPVVFVDSQILGVGRRIASEGDFTKDIARFAINVFFMLADITIDNCIVNMNSALEGSFAPSYERELSYGLFINSFSDGTALTWNNTLCATQFVSCANIKDVDHVTISNSFFNARGLDSFLPIGPSDIPIRIVRPNGDETIAGSMLELVRNSPSFGDCTTVITDCQAGHSVSENNIHRSFIEFGPLIPDFGESFFSQKYGN